MNDFVKKIFKIAKPFRRVFLTLFLFLIVSQLLNLASPYIYGKIIDSLIAKNTLAQTLIFIVIAGVVYVAANLISYLQAAFDINRFGYDFSAFVAHQTLEKFFGFSIGQHVNQHSGIKQSVIKRGESALNNLTNLMVYEVLPVVTETVIITIALLFLVPVIGFMVVFFDAVFILYTLFMNSRIMPDLKRYKDQESDESKFYSELMRNVELVQINAQEKRLSADYDGLVGKLFDFGKSIWLRFVVMSSARSVLVSMVKILVMVVGVYLVYLGKYTPGYLVIIFSWTSNVFNNLWKIGNAHRRGADYIASIKKYFDLMEVEPDIKEVANPIMPEKFDGKIEFKNVSFKYPAHKYLADDDVNKEDVLELETKEVPEALTGVSFVVESGQKVAFVGHSGAGKTTITHLLLRAYDPDKGQVLIDGLDLKNLDIKNYRQNLGVVEQSVSLFDNTLRYNILLGVSGDRGDVKDEDLDNIAKLTCIDKFYNRLERGFDTIIGEKGVKLSGGERQRVGIARALIKEPRILIFDEATSSLDTENEALIHQAIEKASEGRTTIIIAHRLSTIKDADKIFVLDKGKLIGEGAHSELMETCEQYKNLINKQVVANS